LPVNSDSYRKINEELNGKNIALVAVSKTKPAQEILELYKLGQRDFGENYVNELTEKYEQLPKDIYWHFIGHLQSNKVKYIAPFISLIHGVDSDKLLIEIDKQARKNNRVVDCLLQVHIAKEETKFGLNEKELHELLTNATNLPNVHIRGLMGMASFTDDINIVRSEFKFLKSLFDKYFPQNNQGDERFKTKASHPRSEGSFISAFGGVKGLPVLSMGMSADYKIAIEEGSNMVRIGSLLFGNR